MCPGLLMRVCLCLAKDNPIFSWLSMRSWMIGTHNIPLLNPPVLKFKDFPSTSKFWHFSHTSHPFFKFLPQTVPIQSFLLLFSELQLFVTIYPKYPQSLQLAFLALLDMRFNNLSIVVSVAICLASSPCLLLSLPSDYIWWLDFQVFTPSCLQWELLYVEMFL